MKITFLPGNRTIETDGSEPLLSVALKADVVIDGNCGGVGVCGKCRVQVLGGNPDTLTEEEKKCMTGAEIKNGFRLACCLFPKGDMEIRVPQYEGALKRKSDMSVMPPGFHACSGFEKKAVTPEKASLENQLSDESRLKVAFFAEGDGIVVPSLLGELSKLMGDETPVTATARGREIIHIEAGDRSGECYGFSFDIGTTTVVGMLWNLISGELLGVKAASNPQATHGADVISRIMFAGDGGKNLRVLRNEIIKCLNHIVGELTKDQGVSADNIYKAVIAGNTTMSHLVLGVNPKRLALAPFTPVFCDEVNEYADVFGIDINRRAIVTVMPNIAGHVGSDITAGIIASGILEKPGNHLMIDVGTNGEIVLCANGKALACSTAAGPAFEGAAIYQGMRAAAGAIEHVDIEGNEVSISVIEDEKPVGLCGSGIIDASAEIFKAGLIEKSGRLVTSEKALENGVDIKIASRLREGKTGREFVLAYAEDEGDIVITQNDIREIQLAKAAIRAGITLMLKELRLDAYELQCIYIAGAFGNHIRTRSAVKIGLIPDIGEDKITYIGNAAGAGAGMALLSEKAGQDARAAAKMVRHMELATDPMFQGAYLSAMSF